MTLAPVPLAMRNMSRFVSLFPSAPVRQCGATCAVLDRGFHDTGIARVDSGVYVIHPGSRCIHAMPGFTETGRNRVFPKAHGCEADHVNFILAREDWTQIP